MCWTANGNQSSPGLSWAAILAQATSVPLNNHWKLGSTRALLTGNFGSTPVSLSQNGRSREPSWWRSLSGSTSIWLNLAFHLLFATDRIPGGQHIRRPLWALSWIQELLNAGTDSARCSSSELERILEEDVSSARTTMTNKILKASFANVACKQRPSLNTMERFLLDHGLHSLL